MYAATNNVSLTLLMVGTLVELASCQHLACYAIDRIDSKDGCVQCVLTCELECK